MVVTIDLKDLKEGNCLIIDFGNDERVVCMENNKLKIFKLIK